MSEVSVPQFSVYSLDHVSSQRDSYKLQLLCHNFGLDTLHDVMCACVLLYVCLLLCSVCSV